VQCAQLHVQPRFALRSVRVDRTQTVMTQQPPSAADGGGRSDFVPATCTAMGLMRDWLLSVTDAADKIARAPDCQEMLLTRFEF
jgi:hypothetical protein